MKLAHTIDDARAARATLAGSVGFVPTMGALHAGHVSLIEAARRLADRVVVSIFVNPTQFGPNEDFHRYPRPLDADLALCERAGVDLVFNPAVDEMYPPGAAPAAVDVPALTGLLDGLHRPGHFAGVCQVVAKLFNVVQPTLACFGEKDFQQLAVLTAMTRGLDLPVRIVPCPTLRDPDGMAMSSRNRYLSAAERARGLAISHSLFAARAAVEAGERDVATLLSTMRTILLDVGHAGDGPVALDYAAIVDARTLQPIERLTPGVGARALVALRVGSTRLIDNVALNA